MFALHDSANAKESGRIAQKSGILILIRGLEGILGKVPPIWLPGIFEESRALVHSALWGMV